MSQGSSQLASTPDDADLELATEGDKQEKNGDRIGNFTEEYPQLQMSEPYSAHVAEAVESDCEGTSALSLASSPLLEVRDAEEGSSSRFWVTFHLLCLTHFLTCMDQLLTSPHLTDIARSFNMNDVERDKKIGGQVHMALLMAGTPFLLFTALFSDRLPCKPVYVCVMIVIFASDVAVYFTQDYAVFFALRCCASLQTSTWPLIIGFLCRMYHEDHRAAKLSVIGASASVGMGAGQLLSLFAGDNMDWRRPFLIVGVVGLASTAVFAAVADSPVSRQQVKFGRKWYQTDPETLSLNNIIVISQGMLQCVPTILMAVFINDYLFVDKHATSKIAAFCVNALFGIGIFAGQIAAPYVFECTRFAVGSAGSKLNILKFIICGFYLIPVLPIITVVRAPFSMWLCVPAFTAGFALGANDILTSVAALHLNNYATQFKIMSLYSMADSFGKGLGALLIAEIVAQTNREFAFSVTPLFWVLCSVMFCFIKTSASRA